MIETLELFDHFDLSSDDDKLQTVVTGLSKKKIVDICTSLSNSLELAVKQPEERSIFDVVASGSLAAQHGHSCKGPECRLDKLSKLGVFSTFYADQVFLPDYFSSLKHLAKNSSEDELKIDFYYDMVILNRLRPYFDAGFLKIVTYGACPNCSEEKLKFFDDTFNKDYLASVEEYYLSMASCEVSMSDGHPCLVLNISTDLNEHGQVYIFTDSLVSRFTMGHKLSKREIKEIGFIQLIINNTLSHLRLQIITNSFLSTTFLTDSLLHQKFLTHSLNNENGKLNSALEKLLIHTPIFDNVSPEKVIKLREADGDSFEIYRSGLKNSLKELISNKTSITTDMVKEFYDDKIRPEVFKLDKKIKLNRTNLINKALTNASILGLSLGVGISTGFIQPQVIQSLGLFTAISQIGTTVTEAITKGSDVKTNEFYFLWKLSQK